MVLLLVSAVAVDVVSEAVSEFPLPQAANKMQAGMANDFNKDFMMSNLMMNNFIVLLNYCASRIRA
jgi:hypothetical protein